ncbi:MAG TPA: phospholipase D-like domain-containing protein [Kiritimatiellia bacterium]|nr:phospholipase D-like domain-containing protein [Kiritimatiellia bacterium]HPS08179.1 phospholipase D-like domain-containing protein [Kiritimatiellia bacterium]
MTDVRIRVLGQFALLITMTAVAPGCCYHAVKPLPAGLSYRSELLPATEVRFLCDQTCLDDSGVRVIDQQIFDEVFAMIAQAERLVVVDMFLFNEFLGAGPAPHRRLCEELTAALVARKRAVPGLHAVLITDPVNTVYGGMESSHLKRLQEAGVEVVVTRLDRLRDSNTTWSSMWRLFFKPWGNRSGGGWVANPFDGGEVTLRSWLALLNFKANHRKVVVADAGGELRALVTSANPHDGSSAHSNVGLVFSGPAVRPALETEQAVLAFSGGRTIASNDVPMTVAGPNPSSAGSLRVQIVTEEAIADAAEAMIGAAGESDALDLVMFYLADRPIIDALTAAARRGVTMRVVLDPNKDAFGREKSGMPNRQVARELVAAGVPLRWAVTRGEQMHAKMLLVKRADGTADLLLGSANFTRRNVRDYNLETDVRVAGRVSAPALADAAAHVERIWTNSGGRVFTADYGVFRDDSLWRVFRYRFQEATGICTW